MNNQFKPSPQNKSIQNNSPVQSNFSKLEEIPDNYIDKAEKIMSNLKPKITTSKIRSFLSLTSEVYNVENKRTEKLLNKESLEKIKQIRVKMVYEAGRDQGVKNFINESKLIYYLKNIGDNREKFIKFARYMEALVAYHRYFGGKEC